MKWWIGMVIVAAVVLGAALSLRGAGQAEAPETATAGSVAALADSACTVIRPPTRLAGGVRETSGLAVGSAGTLWTHNDAGGDALLFGYDTAARQIARVAVTGAELVDWEDIEAAPCAEDRCLFIADIGDNDGRRDHITIYRVPEPAADVREVPATALHARYPEGPQDAEALAAGPDGSLYIITKGEHGPIRLYRLPAGSAAGVTTLELVSELAPQPSRRDNRVTGAATSHDGRWLAFRTYDNVYFHEAAALLAGDADGRSVMFSLRPLNEPQGEGLALDAAGDVWLTSEAESGGEPFLTGLSCPYGG